MRSTPRSRQLHEKPTRAHARSTTAASNDTQVAFTRTCAHMVSLRVHVVAWRLFWAEYQPRVVDVDRPYACQRLAMRARTCLRWRTRVSRERRCHRHVLRIPTHGVQRRYALHDGCGNCNAGLIGRTVLFLLGPRCVCWAHSVICWDRPLPYAHPTYTCAYTHTESTHRVQTQSSHGHTHYARVTHNVHATRTCHTHTGARDPCVALYCYAEIAPSVFIQGVCARPHGTRATERARA